jgi:hypothetical protein
MPGIATLRRAADRNDVIGRALAMGKVDFGANVVQPSPTRLLLATLTSLVGSIGADALLVAIGTAIFPSTRGFVHFRFADYARLTIVGVIIACAAWPVVTRTSSAARWWFFRMAIAVTAVLLVPDLWIWTRGSSGLAVLVLVVMHLAIAIITYNALVRLAPARAES